MRTPTKSTLNDCRNRHFSAFWTASVAAAGKAAGEEPGPKVQEAEPAEHRRESETKDAGVVLDGTGLNNYH